MIQQSFNSILSSLLGSKLVQGMTGGDTLSEYIKKQKTAREKEEAESTERAIAVLAGQGITGEEVEGQDSGALWDMYSQEIGLEGLADTISSGRFDPATASKGESRLVEVMRSKAGQAAMHRQREMIAQRNLRESLEQQRERAKANEKGGNQ